MMINQQTKNQHLLWRANFGMQAEQIALAKSANEKKLYKTLESTSSAEPEFINVTQARSTLQNNEGMDKMQQPATAEERKMAFKQRRKALKNL